MSITSNNVHFVYYLFVLLGVIIVTYPYGVICEGTFSLRILHSGQTKSHILPVDLNSHKFCSPEVYKGNGSNCVGGVARRAQLIRQLRNNQTLVVDTGGLLDATIFSAYYGPSIVSFYMDKMMYDVQSLSPWDFRNEGYVDRITEFVTNCTFAVVSSTREPLLPVGVQDKVKQHQVLTYNNERVGVVSYLEDSQVNRSTVIDAVRREVSKLLDQGVNKIVALGSSGGIDLVEELVRNIYGIDVFVLRVENNCYPHNNTIVELDTTWGSKIVVASGSFYGYDLGLVDVLFDDFGKVLGCSGSLRLLDQAIPSDPSIGQDVEQRWYSGVEKLQDSVLVGSSLVLNSSDCTKTYSCPLGNAIAHSIKQLASVNVAWVNSSLFSYAFPPGNLTLDNITSILPFNTSVYMFSVSGQDLVSSLERTIGGGDFIQFSGVHIEWDIATKSIRTLFIADLEGNFALVDEKAHYTVAVLEGDTSCDITATTKISQFSLWYLLTYWVGHPADASNADGSGIIFIDPSSGDVTLLEYDASTSTPEDWEIALIVVGGVFLLALIISFAFFVIKRKQKKLVFMDSTSSLPPDFYSLVYMRAPLFVSEEILSVTDVKLQEFENLLLQPEFCVSLSRLMNVESKRRELAAAIMHIYEFHDRSLLLFQTFVQYGTDPAQNEVDITFRRSTILSDMFETYAIITGLPYLWKTLATPLQRLNEYLATDEDVENRKQNLLKLTPSLNLTAELDPEEQNLSKWQIMMALQEVFVSFTKSIKTFPVELAAICQMVHANVTQVYSGIEHLIVGSLVFKYFIIPALLAPKEYGLLPDLPPPESQRLLQVFAQVLTKLIDYSRFTDNERFLYKMNDFIVSNTEPLQSVFHQLVKIADDKKRLKSESKRSKKLLPPSAHKNYLYFIYEYVAKNIDRISEYQASTAVDRKNFEQLVNIYFNPE